MAKLKNEKEYRAALKRIDELLPITGDGTPEDDHNENHQEPRNVFITKKFLTFIILFDRI